MPGLVTGGAPMDALRMAMDASYYQTIYQRALDQTGSVSQAQEAVSVAEAALRAIYHEAMVRSGGDDRIAAAVEQQMSGPVARLAQLIPVIRSDELDTDARARALRDLMDVMESMGYTGGRQGLHSWLRQNVQDDGVLRAAGFDPRAVRTLPRPEGWPDDLEALMTLLRERLELLQRISPERITDAEISAQLDVFRASAHRFGYETAGTTARTVEGGGPVPAGAVPVGDLAGPRRV